MRIVKVLYMFCVCLNIVCHQICSAGDIACLNRAYRTMNEEIQNLLTDRFQYAATDKISDTQKKLFKTAVYYKDKFIADKFVKDYEWISLINSMQNTRNIEPAILKVLDSPINMLRKIGLKQWTKYWTNDICRTDTMKKAMLVSIKTPLTRAFKLIGSINPSVSFENAVFWMFLNVEEDTASDFEKIGYITCLANALGKYKSVTNDQDVQPTIDSLQNICIAMLNDMAEEQQHRASTPSIPDKKYMNKQYKMQSEMPRNQYQKLKQD